jgi:hypothetical protein
MYMGYVCRFRQISLRHKRLNGRKFAHSGHSGRGDVFCDYDIFI